MRISSFQDADKTFRFVKGQFQKVQPSSVCQLAGYRPVARLADWLAIDKSKLEISKLAKKSLRCYSKFRMADQDTLNELIDILKEYHPEKIILFGSSAVGKQSKKSDIDLCILKRITNPPFKEKRVLWRLLWDQGYDFKIEPDLHLYDTREFDQRLKAGDPFIEEIAKGKVAYEK